MGLSPIRPQEDRIPTHDSPNLPRPLDSLALRPMPRWASGALVRTAPAHPEQPITVLWVPDTAPRLPFGRVLLRWEKAAEAGWDVTAHLGLASTDVHLATWPAAPDDWPHLVRPTLHEVTCLCPALAVATAALDLANRIARP
ncbi:esterase [Kitasatospora sp. LaBMicrA B282]|uniref:esterase n=1 Tax=Kitasatospora sp. LaBMicrA B282 TaxID=3420949 RepID=UPI003D0F1DB4